MCFTYTIIILLPFIGRFNVCTQDNCITGPSCFNVMYVYNTRFCIYEQYKLYKTQQEQIRRIQICITLYCIVTFLFNMHTIMKYVSFSIASLFLAYFSIEHFKTTSIYMKQFSNGSCSLFFGEALNRRVCFICVSHV